MEVLKTAYRAKKEARDLEIYNRFKSLRLDPANQPMAVLDLIREEFGIASYPTIYRTIARVEARING
jgi:hypothetical protein